MKRMTRVAMLLACTAVVVPASAQEPARPNLLLEISRPQQAIPIDSSMRDDILARPAPPRADPLRDSFRLHVGVGDPRCFPGEEGFIPERIPSGTRRRSR